MTRNIVIVHGVQTGDNEDAVKGPKQMAKSLERYLDGRATFKASYPAYEDLNEELQEKFRTISKLILNRLKNPVGTVFDKLIDLVGDVFVYRDDEGGETIRKLVRKTVEASPNCILVGHSLGSVVCFDIVCEMMEQGLFKGKARDAWPVTDLVTFGSPLALDMFKSTRNLVPHHGTQNFDWYNYSDRNDPVITGNIFGKAFEQNNLMRDTYGDSSINTHIHDRQVNTGFHLLSHINYWKQQHIIQRLAQLI